MALLKTPQQSTETLQASCGVASNDCHGSLRKVNPSLKELQNPKVFDPKVFNSFQLKHPATFQGTTSHICTVSLVSNSSDPNLCPLPCSTIHVGWRAAFPLELSKYILFSRCLRFLLPLSNLFLFLPILNGQSLLLHNNGYFIIITGKISSLAGTFHNWFKERIRL